MADVFDDSFDSIDFDVIDQNVEAADSVVCVTASSPIHEPDPDPDLDSDPGPEPEPKKPPNARRRCQRTKQTTLQKRQVVAYLASQESKEELPGTEEMAGPSDATQYCQSVLSKLVTQKDVLTEAFLKEVLESLPQRDDLSATELYRLWKDEARKRITKFSVTLSHKLSPLVQIMLDQKLAANMETTFVEVDTHQPSLKDMVWRYERCFNTWIDDAACVSFKATNTRLLGQVEVKDIYILTFFAFCTCRRARDDNILQLGLVGASTSGKSTLFESCLAEGSHVTTNEQGVGRFQVGNKPVLLFHDVEIRTIALSKDTEKIKTIARTEPTVTKIHGSTYTLQPLFLFFSSNERLMTHKFVDGADNKPFQWRLYHSQVNELGGKKRATDENLKAVQNRFIECFVRKPPKLIVDDLPKSGGFLRIHGILGMYRRIIAIMEKYHPSDFHSPVLRQYVLHGLCSNYARFVSIMLIKNELGESEEDAKPSTSASTSHQDFFSAGEVNACLRNLIAKHIDISLQTSLLQYL